MKIEELAAHFGSIWRLCKRLNITPQNATKWKKQGYIPLLHQAYIEKVTDKKLCIDKDLLNEFMDKIAILEELGYIKIIKSD